jgi:predicted DNA-binding ribbon-helix-helix protein
MRSALIKRSIVIAGRKTSVSLEDDFWNGLKEAAREHKRTLSDLVSSIDVRRSNTNLSSAVRIFVLDYFRSQIPRTRTNRVEAGTELRGIAHRSPVAAGEQTNY